MQFSGEGRPLSWFGFIGKRCQWVKGNWTGHGHTSKREGRVWLEWEEEQEMELKRLEGAKFCRTWWAMGRHFFFFNGKTLKDLKQEDAMGFASWKSSFSYGMEYRLEQLRMEAGRAVRIDQVKVDGNLVQRLGGVSGEKEMDLQRDLRSQHH